MTDRPWTSVHTISPLGLLKTTWRPLLLAGIFLPLGVIMLCLPMNPDEQVLVRTVAVSIIVGGLVLAGVSPWKYLGQASSVQLEEEGLSWRRGGQEKTCRWEDVAEVYRTEVHILRPREMPSDWNRRTDLRVVFQDGSQIRFSHALSGYDDLADGIQRATTEHLLPGALAAFRGTGVALGPVRLGRKGLVINGHPISWNNLVEVSVEDGYLHCFEGRSKPRSVAMKEIPNYLLLIALLGAQGVQVAEPPLA